MARVTVWRERVSEGRVLDSVCRCLRAVCRVLCGG
jgi:hypothetical protein